MGLLPGELLTAIAIIYYRFRVFRILILAALYRVWMRFIFEVLNAKIIAFLTADIVEI